MPRSSGREGPLWSKRCARTGGGGRVSPGGFRVGPEAGGRDRKQDAGPGRGARPGRGAGPGVKPLWAAVKHPESRKQPQRVSGAASERPAAKRDEKRKRFLRNQRKSFTEHRTLRFFLFGCKTKQDCNPTSSRWNGPQQNENV